MNDKRQEPRCAKSFSVRYSCAKGPIIVESKTDSKDISLSGMRLSLDDTLKISDRVKLSVELPWQPQPLEAIAKIVWASPREITNNMTIERDCGLKFLWTSSSDIKKAIS